MIVPPASPYWHLFTRLGEAQVLAPLAAAALAGLWTCPAQRGVAKRWLLGFVAALALTLVSKVAFMGWGIGSAALDFTGFSGHAMSAASVLPLLAWLGLQASGSAPWRAGGLTLAFALAAAIAYSRLPVGAHSASEAVLGFLIGAAASGWAVARPFGEALTGTLRIARRALAERAARASRATHSAGATPASRGTGSSDATTVDPTAVPARVLRRSAALAVLMTAVLAAAPWVSPPTRSHQWVTALSLKLSGRQAPFTRPLLHRRAAAVPMATTVLTSGAGTAAR